METKKRIYRKKDLDTELRQLARYFNNLYNNINTMEKNAQSMRLEVRILNLMKYFDEVKQLKSEGGDAPVFGKIEELEHILGNIYLKLHKLNHRSAKPVKTAPYIKEGIARISGQSISRSLNQVAG
ncbi:MAG: hypothetical protein ACT6QS_10810 [Flavobacteriales bacterium]